MPDDERTGRGRKVMRSAAGAIGALAAVLVLACAALAYRALAYVDPYHARVAAAGYVARTVHVNRVALRYVEGPDNGPPLVLLHAQHLDWFGYSRVLPALARSFHVYDIDYPGHGATAVPADYPMTAQQIGADLADFIARQVGKPVFISGNSSGGLLAAWLAANRPALVRAVLLEDPPLFSSEYPRIRRTIADRSFATSARAVRDRTTDFLSYWIHDNAGFFERRVGPGTPFLLARAVQAYRHAHPGAPVEIGLLENDTVRLLVRGLDEYDPRFGAAFHDGSWNRGFDHADALRRIACPVLLMQANSRTLADGTLDGAMSPEQAGRAMALLKRGTYMKVDSGHVVNIEKPDEFVAALGGFLAGR